MNTPSDKQNLPQWGKAVIAINLLLAILSLITAFPLIGKCIETSFQVPDDFKAMVAGAFLGAFLAIVSAFGLTQAYKGRAGWTLAVVIMLAYFVLLSSVALFATTSPRASVNAFFYVEPPIRLLSWIGLIALYVRQRKSTIAAEADGAANGSQPSRSETSSTSSAAGSRRSP